MEKEVIIIMKKFIWVLLACLLFTVVGCTAEKKSTPEQTIKNYFIAYNDKNFIKFKIDFK